VPILWELLQENEAEVEHDVSEEPVDEVYTQHQEVYPGVQGVVSVIHQRVPDPSASHFLAKRPAYSRKSILEIATQFGIPDLPLELKIWLLKNQGIEGSAVQTALDHFSLPEKWRSISVWTRVRVTLPLAGVSREKVETRAIYAQPSMRKDQLPCFDTVLVDLGNDNPDPQVGLSGEWLPSKAKNI
jgi:hypothetical protein